MSLVKSLIGLFNRRSVRLGLFLALLGLILALPHLSRAGRQGSNASTTQKRHNSHSVPGEILVRFKESSPATKTGAAKTELLIEQGPTNLTIDIEQLAGTEVVSGLRLARVAPAETQRAIMALRERSDVLYAEPNYIRRKDNVPNDARYGELWGLKNSGQSGGVAGTDIKAEQAWDVTTGSRNIVVAVIDEGIDVQHQDLQPNIWRNSGEVAGNGVDDDANGFIDDVNGYDFYHNDGSVYDGPGLNPDDSEIDAHGTHVAGTIGAQGNNGSGVVGVNWQVSLMSLKFLGPDGGTSADAIRAYGYVKTMRERWINSGGTLGANIRVTNNSYGGSGYSQAEADAIQAMGSVGTLFVASAGNDSDDNNRAPSYPATYDLPSVISVAAIDRTGALSNFSNRGSRTVHLAAPGTSVLSTTPGNTYQYYNGTSMASPHVAGTAALVLAAHSDFTVARLRGAILFGTEAASSTTQTTVTGGQLSAAGSLQNANEADTVAPAAISNLAVMSQDDRSVALNWTAPGDDGNAGQASLYEIRFVDAITGARFLLAVRRPANPGTLESGSLNVPFRHSNGSFEIRAIDNAGNTSNTSINVAVATDEIVNPYSIATGATEPLSTGGFPLGVDGDDEKVGFGLPFSFPFYDNYYSSVVITSNGVLYFDFETAPSSDPFNNPGTLNGRAMIAGMWDDLDLRECFRTNSDVFRVIPDSDRVIFRWEGVRFTTPICPGAPTGTNPVNFEIELHRNGTIKTRYGQNTPLFPVVGIGGGEPEGHLISSHSSTSTLLDLTNAPTITYSLRRLPNLADLSLTSTSSSNIVPIGQDVTFNLTATNGGPKRTGGVTIANTIPGNSTFVSCTTSQGSCSGLSNGKVQINLGALDVSGAASAAITVRPILNAGPFINQATVSASLSDPNITNNSASSFVQVISPNNNPQTGIVGIGAGGLHSFGIRSDGYGLAWGANYAGQLGDNSLSNKSRPVRVGSLKPITVIDGGASHSLAIKADGTVWSWGENDSGQLGDGTTTDKRSPIQINGLSGIVRISGGANHSLALRNDGTVWAWGGNGNGQLGDGTTTGHLQPAQVAGLSGIVAIAAGFNHSLAVKNDGTVWAWGGNESGQLGDSTNAQRLTPVQLTGISNASAVFANDAYAFLGPGGITVVTFSAALRSDGTVWTWGHNWRGQLGDGTTNNRSVPGQVAGLTGVTSVGTGGFHMIALRNDGSVWSWGGNFDGQLGSTTTTDRYTPAPVVWLAGITAIVAGTEHNLALRQDGHVLGWGSYSHGQLGFGGTVGSLTYPFEVSMQIPDAPPIGIVSTPTFSPPSGTLAAPTNVSLASATATNSIQSLYVGGRHNFARLSNGAIYGWGNNERAQLGVDPGSPMPDPAKTVVKIPLLISGLDNVTSISLGGRHNLALKTDGTVWSSGSNHLNELGRVTGIQSVATFGQVQTVSGIVAVSAGDENSVALKADGSVWAWGAGPINNSVATGLPPVQVNGLANITAIECGAASFAIRNDGTLWAWGNNYQGVLGDGTETHRPIPVQVSGLTNVTAVSSGGTHTLALKSDGTVWAWGNNTYGQLGLGFDFSSRLTPVQVPGLTGITAISAGIYHSLALKADGTVWVWGENSHGELGDGTGTQRRSPVQILGITGVASIAAGYQHSAVRTSNGTLYMFGMNDYGQVGDGTTDNQLGPVAMTQLTGGVKIHYTTNGADPSDNDPFLASGAAISINQTTVLKAQAYKEGWTPSAIATATYTLTPQGGPMQLANATYSIGESGGVASVNVSRTGDSSVAAAVDYATADTAGLNNCNQVNGIASSRCDYATSVGTVRFDVGQSSKSISIPIVDDAYAEGSETFNIILRNPAGGSLGSTTTAFVTITDNETSNGTNPLDQTPFFVRQQYVDFLGREPDPGGFAAWQNVINNCPAGSTDCDRIHVSSGFFRSPEFQGRGYFVYRFYPVAFGRKPEYVEFIPDLAKVSGFLSDTELEAARVAFIAEFMSRPAFVTKFDGLNNTQYVDMLLATAGITHSARDFWIGSLGNGTRTRAEVLREIAESTEVYNKYYNQAFVVMQYFGYLRRDPDALYLDWIQVLETTGDFRGMVNGFMNSSEYRFRFGP